MQLRKFLVLILILGSTQITQAAGSCGLWKKVNESPLKENSQFWSDVSAFSKNGSISDFNLQELMKKHGYADTSASSATTAASVRAPITQFQIARPAGKGIEKLQPHIRASYDEFVSTLQKDGILGIRNNPGKWRLEELVGESNMSARLNGAYRVKFTVEGDKINVLDVGNHIGH